MKVIIILVITSLLLSISDGLLKEILASGITLIAPVLKALGRSTNYKYQYKNGSLGQLSLDTLLGKAAVSFFRSLKASTHVGDLLQGIAIGTRWCGAGNVSARNIELGEFTETDVCCRDHDHCTDNIIARSYSPQFDLTNRGLFTRSRCSCDGAFFRCLKKTNLVYSNVIALLYFNVLRPKCFEATYDVVKCAKTSQGNCIVHYFNPATPKRFHWFDNPVYCVGCSYPQYTYFSMVKTKVKKGIFLLKRKRKARVLAVNPLPKKVKSLIT